nr:hypothetical protein CFP56_14630 [Quercus suber]
MRGSTVVGRMLETEIRARLRQSNHPSPAAVEASSSAKICSEQEKVETKNGRHQAPPASWRTEGRQVRTDRHSIRAMLQVFVAARPRKADDGTRSFASHYLRESGLDSVWQAAAQKLQEKCSTRVLIRWGGTAAVQYIDTQCGVQHDLADVDLAHAAHDNKLEETSHISKGERVGRWRKGDYSVDIQPSSSSSPSCIRIQTMMRSMDLVYEPLGPRVRGLPAGVTDTFDEEELTPSHAS